MVFEKKKIQSETLGEYLREVRQNLGFNREQVAAKSGIRTKILTDLESGDFKFLPPDVYVLGFLRQLAGIYSIESQTLLEQYKKEKQIQNQLRQRQALNKTWLKKYFGNVVVTPKFLSILFGGIFVAATLFYIVWQVMSINKLPSLEILQPKEGQLITESFVNVAGKTDPGMSVSINGQDVFVDQGGNFKSQLSLEAGPKDLKIIAENKFDKSTSKTISVVGQQQAGALQSQVQLRLDFLGEVAATVAVDEGPGQNFSFHKGDSKVFIGQNKVVTSVSDAGLTKAALNGQNLGLLGRSGEKLSGIPFFAVNATVNTPK